MLNLAFLKQRNQNENYVVFDFTRGLSHSLYVCNFQWTELQAGLSTSSQKKQKMCPFTKATLHTIHMLMKKKHDCSFFSVASKIQCFLIYKPDSSFTKTYKLTQFLISASCFLRWKQVILIRHVQQVMFGPFFSKYDVFCGVWSMPELWGKRWCVSFIRTNKFRFTGRISAVTKHHI